MTCLSPHSKLWQNRIPRLAFIPLSPPAPERLQRRLEPLGSQDRKSPGAVRGHTFLRRRWASEAGGLEMGTKTPSLSYMGRAAGSLPRTHTLYPPPPQVAPTPSPLPQAPGQLELREKAEGLVRLRPVPWVLGSHSPATRSYQEPLLQCPCNWFRLSFPGRHSPDQLPQGLSSPQS